MGYLVGSFPSGYLSARLLKGVDPREHGSGRTGGTNVLRSAGRGAAALAVIGDVAKGALPVILAQAWLGTDAAAVIAGLAAVFGHNHSLFLRFRGGAGSATNFGVLLALFPLVTPAVLAAAGITAYVSRMASVASIAAAVVMVLALLASYLLSHAPAAYLIYGVLACAMIIFELRPNIQRLRAGSERRVEHL
jgi:glycerol-3-phosphate acyltransferase PlsY